MGRRFDPSEETSFSGPRDRRGRHRGAGRSRAGAFYRSDELSGGNEPWHSFPMPIDADRPQGARSRRGASATGSGTCTSAARADMVGLSTSSQPARAAASRAAPEFPVGARQADVPAESVITRRPVDAEVEGARGVGITGVLIDRRNRSRPRTSEACRYRGIESAADRGRALTGR